MRLPHIPQNGREDCVLTSALMTPPRSSTFLDTSLHKDVFGVISGTCESKKITLKTFLGEKICVCHLKPLFCCCYCCCCSASPHTSSTPNINSVRHADSRGSLISTDSANSLSEKHNDKGNSLDKVQFKNAKKARS